MLAIVVVLFSSETSTKLIGLCFVMAALCSIAASWLNGSDKPY